MHIIKDGKITSDDICHLDDTQPPAETQFTVSCKRWKTDKESLLHSDKAIGIRLSGDDAVSDIANDLSKMGVIVLEFSSFRDGRAFSLARLLRDRYDYKGEIRVRGDFIRDQVYFLARVGVNAFEPAEGTELQKLLPALTEFSVSYQAAADGIEPAFRKRG